MLHPDYGTTADVDGSTLTEVTHEGESYGEAPDLGEIATALRVLAARAAAGPLSPEDVTLLGSLADDVDVWDEVVGD